MSWQAQAWAWGQTKINGTQKLVLLALANRTGEDHSCWPSIARLSEDTCLSERTVQRALRELETDGYIRGEARKKATSMYKLLVPGRLVFGGKGDNLSRTEGDRLSHNGADGCQSDTYGVSESPNMGDTVTPESKRESTREPEKSAQAREEHSLCHFFQEGRFREEWTKYPPAWAAYADEQGVQPQGTWEDFRDHFLSNGQNVANWDARWRKWCREAAKRQTEAAQQAGGDINPAYFEEWTPEQARQQEREYFEAERRRNANGG